MMYSLEGQGPELPEEGRWWVAPGAQVVGRVRLGLDASIWFGAILRGDNELIDIGARSNVQDGAILHTDPGFPLRLGEDVTVGHRAILHGCEIGAGSLVGMGATILNGARIGAGCIVGANALVTEGKVFPDGTLVVGAPARVVKSLDAAAIEGLRRSAARYVANARRYTAELSAVD